MVWKILHIVLLAAFKYILTLPYAMIIGLEYKYAILALLAGGIGGFLFFFYLSKKLNHRFNRFGVQLRALVPQKLKMRFRLARAKFPPKKKVRLFSKKNRYMVRLKRSYGFWGIIIATPILLTIPIGAFLANKYYGRQKHVVVYMILSIVGWGAVLSGFVHLFPKVFF